MTRRLSRKSVVGGRWGAKPFLQRNDKKPRLRARFSFVQGLSFLNGVTRCAVCFFCAQKTMARFGAEVRHIYHRREIICDECDGVT